MKTQVIRLDPHDDATSVRDKMTWAKTARILLVYPRRSHALRRVLDLRLLQRHAASLGAQLAIVAPLEEIRFAAKQVGLPIFKNVALAERRTWMAGEPDEPPARRNPRTDLRQLRREVYLDEPPWRNLLAVRLLFFSLAVLAVLVLLLLFLPSATVELKPETQLQSLSISASANPKVATVSLTGSLPARLTFSVLEKSKTATVTGSLVIPSTVAAGLVRFRNLTTGVVDVPAGTVVSSTGAPPVRFATTTGTVVPAGAGKTLDVPVQAQDLGSSGNLPADTLVAIEGDLGTSLAVTNPSPTTGGSDHSAPVPTAGDRARLRAALVSEILDQCKTLLLKSIGSGDIYFPDTLAVGQVLSETYFPAEGQSGQTLSLTLNLQCQVQYAAQADLATLASLALDPILPEEFEPVSVGLITLTSSTPVTGADGTTHWKLHAQRLIHAHLDLLDATRLIQGRTRPAAVRRLSGSLRLAAPSGITLKPAWWPWLPIVPFRISISTLN
jgi:Baseplate J-like protein